MVILDASAVLAVLFQEPGADVVEGFLPAAIIGAPNVTEVVTKLIDEGRTIDEAASQFGLLGLSIASFDDRLAVRAGALRGLTKKWGLSLADRACLALAERDKLPVVTADRAWRDLDLGTADRAWRDLDLGIEIRLIR